MTNTSPMADLSPDKLLSWPSKHNLAPETVEGWYIACVTSQGELQAREDLQERGYEAVVPTRTTTTRVHRTARKTKDVDLPLLPGLIFVSLVDYSETSVLLALPFIHRFLGSGELSSRLRPGDLDWLREVLLEPLGGQVDSPPDWYKVGQICTVIDGALSAAPNLEVEIKAISGKKPYLATVSLPFFNEIEIPLESLRPV